MSGPIATSSPCRRGGIRIPLVAVLMLVGACGGTVGGEDEGVDANPCGDSAIAAAEECDDGNVADGDTVQFRPGVSMMGGDDYE